MNRHARFVVVSLVLVGLGVATMVAVSMIEAIAAIDHMAFV